MKFDDWYKNNIEEHREEPPSFLWNEIETQMDIADVWSNIETEFDHRDDLRIRTWTRWVAAAVVVLFTSLSFETPNSYLVSLSETHLPDLSPKTYNATIEKALACNTATAQLKHTEITINQENTSTGDQIAALLHENGFNNYKKEQTKQSKITTALDPVMAEYIFAHTASNGMHYLSPMNEFDDGNKYYHRPLLNRISFGVIGSYNNTWLLDRQQFNQVADTEGSTSMSGLGKNIGIISSIDYSKNLMFQVELVHTETDQNYQKAFSNKFVPDELSLNYVNVNLLAVRKINHFLSDLPASHNFITGIGFGYLTQAQLSQRNKRTDVREDFAKENISFSLGYEYEVYPTKSWSVSSGLRANYGLSNIERILYSEFNDNRSNTFTWGGHVTIKYHLSF